MATLRSRRLWLWITVLIGVLVVSVPIAFVVAWMFGLFMPLQHAEAERNTATLEHRLVVGESRADVERQFGDGIPQPDHRRDYVADTAEAAGSGYTRVSEYSYFSGSEFCYGGYLGVVVYYDAHNRVKGWKQSTWGDGC
jgi:hypothetical protein